MSLTEQDLRDLLKERTDGASGPEGRLEAVRLRVRHARRRDAIVAVAGAAVLILGSLGIAQRLEPQASGHVVIPAADPDITPTVPSTDPLVRAVTLDGLRLTTSGPPVVHGYSPAGGGEAGDRAKGPRDHPFTVTVVLTNTTTETWRGTVGVALYGYVTDFDENFPLFWPTDGVGAVREGPSRPRWFAIELPDDHEIAGMAAPDSRVIEPGQTITLTIDMVKPLMAGPWQLRGWLPVLDPDGLGAAMYPDAEAYPEVVIG